MQGVTASCALRPCEFAGYLSRAVVPKSIVHDLFCACNFRIAFYSAIPKKKPFPFRGSQVAATASPPLFKHWIAL